MRQIMVAATCLVFMGSQQLVHAQEAPQEPVQYDLAEAWDEFDTIMRDVEQYGSAVRVVAVHCQRSAAHHQMTVEQCRKLVEHLIEEHACEESAPEYHSYLVAGFLEVYLRGALDYVSDTEHPLRDAYALLVQEIVGRAPMCRTSEYYSCAEIAAVVSDATTCPASVATAAP